MKENVNKIGFVCSIHFQKHDRLITDENDPEFMVILGKQKGGLFLPSRSVWEVYSMADKTFRYFLKESGRKFLNVEFSIKKMTIVVLKY